MLSGQERSPGREAKMGVRSSSGGDVGCVGADRVVGRAAPSKEWGQGAPLRNKWQDGPPPTR